MKYIRQASGIGIWTHDLLSTRVLHTISTRLVTSHMLQLNQKYEYCCYHLSVSYPFADNLMIWTKKCFLRSLLERISREKSLSRTMAILFYDLHFQFKRQLTLALLPTVNGWTSLHWRGLENLFCWNAIQLVFLPPIVPLSGKRVVYCCYVNLCLCLWPYLLNFA